MKMFLPGPVSLMSLDSFVVVLLNVLVAETVDCQQGEQAEFSH